MSELPIDLIGSIGFPIFVSVWLLYERTKTTKEFTQAISENTKVLGQLKQLIERCDK